MRIAVLTGLFPVLWETPFLNQITGLVELGHEVDIYADRPQPEGPAHPDITRLALMQRTRYPLQLPLTRGARWAEALRLIRNAQGQDRTTLLRALNPFLFWKRATSLDQLRRTAAFLPVRHYDVCYCPFAQDARRSLRLRKLGVLGGRLVTALRGSDFSRYLAQRGRHVYSKLFREGDLFLPVCDAFASRLLALGCPPGKIVVHHTGINLKRFPYRPRQRLPGILRLITVGRLVEKKGIAYGLRAVRHLVDAGLEITYEIVGGGPLKEALQREVQQLALGSRVRFLNWQTQAQVQQALDRADVLMVPCVTAADGDEEGIPNVLREGMASGLPVIGTTHSGMPELIEDGRTGFLVPERDASAMADRVRRLADHPEIWGSLIAAARSRVEQDDIDVLNQRFVALLQRPLGTAMTSAPAVRAAAPV